MYFSDSTHLTQLCMSTPLVIGRSDPTGRIFSIRGRSVAARGDLDAVRPVVPQVATLSLTVIASLSDFHSISTDPTTAFTSDHQLVRSDDESR